MVRDTMLSKLAEMKRRMDALYAESFKPENEQSADVETAAVDWEPSADITEREDAVRFFIDLPGVLESELTVEVADNRLVVRGKREIPIEDAPASACRCHRERPYGSFRRVFAIPGDCLTESIGAELKAGVLSIEIPRQAPHRGSAHKVEVRSE
ncbi:Hsp20/alpha crystallin family protein [Syntrophobacter fumaroxidans]|mgnify:CR=1 FL=1|nr:Hsp20/alpha crystallin family protein [Syntrophobacter fumaroxidans]